jgi:hypothetical protein
MRQTKRNVVGRSRRGSVAGAVLLWALSGAGAGAALAASADGSADDIILDDLGPGWTRTSPDPTPTNSEGAVRLFSSDDVQLQLLAEPRLVCSMEITGRSDELSLVTALGFKEAPSDTAGVERFAGDLGGADAVAAAFSTRRFAFLVIAFAATPGVDLERAVDPVVDRQAARDGGVVIEAGGTASRLDDIIIDSPSVPGLGRQLDYSTALSVCDRAGPAGVVQALEVVTFVSKHSTERLRVWLDPGSGPSAIVDLTDFPYELFAGFAVGGSLSEGSEPVPLGDIDGLDSVPDARAWRTGGDQPQYFAMFRRGRIMAMIAVAGGSDRAQARAMLGALARLQFDAMPSGATAGLRAPSPAKSVATSGSLIALIGVGVLAIRRARAGRVRRNVVRRGEVGAFDVSHRATEMRHRGAVLGALQVACVAAILVFLASDVGWLRVAGAASTVIAGIVVTVLWRRGEARVLGVSPAERVHPRPSVGSVALTVAAVSLLAAGGGLVVWGLRETLFVPSLTHLRLSDRVSIEPRLLAWLIAAIGLALIVVDSFVLRAARAMARVGWREWTTEAPPIVYLRSFEDDDVQLANVVSARRPFLEFFTLRGRDAFEESVAWELSCYGPVLAIARPGHSHVSLGAARVHLHDDEWRGVISEQIDHAKAIAITIGRTPGLAWELTHIVQSGHLGKTVLLVPPVDPDEIRRRWKFIADTLVTAGAGQHPLPADPGCLVVARVRDGDGDGPMTAYCADRRDEATYRAAVAAVLA